MNKKGFSLIDLILAITLFAVLVGGFAVPLFGSYLNQLELDQQAKAHLILREGWEATRSIRNADFNALVNGDHGLSSGGSVWNFSGVSDESDGFTRVVTITDYERDSVVDPDVKNITISVTWNPVPERTQSLNLSGMLTNYLNPSPWPLP